MEISSDENISQSSRFLQGKENYYISIRSATADSTNQIKNEATSISSPGFESKEFTPATRVLSTTGLLASLGVPLAALIVWLASARVNGDTFTSFSGANIGGRFSQGQAKAIDVVCSALLAPLLLAALDFFWFGHARLSVVYEKHQRGVPLKSLATVSSTASGTFNPITLYPLMQGRTWRLFLFGFLALLSALAGSMLGNIIAYEAYDVNVPTGLTTTLRLLRDAAIESTLVNKGSEYFPATGSNLAVYGYNMSQQADVATQITSLLTKISFQYNTSQLQEGAYIGINATLSSLNAINKTVLALNNVAGYRLSVDCSPNLPSPSSVSVLQPLSRTTTQIQLTNEDASDPNNTMFQANYPGVPEDITGSEGDSYTFAAFSSGTQAAYLGQILRFNLTNQTLYSMPSIYGSVEYRAFNMSRFGFTGTQSTMSVGGLRCSLYRQVGSLNLTRSVDGSTWNVTTSSFSDTKTRVPSMLAQWQTIINFRAPKGVLPGLGPALSYGLVTPTSSGDSEFPDTLGSYTNFAHNFLYTSGEAQRIVYEVAASNTTSDEPDYFYSVSGIKTQTFYRITYVPSLLLLGLLFILCAGAITAGMVLNVWKTLGGRFQKELNVVGLVADAVVGLKVEEASDQELHRLVGLGKVKYEHVTEDGQEIFKLMHVSR
jgi:hypothetical protein